ncbi:MAG: phage head closure protein [Bauldia sp.]
MALPAGRRDRRITIERAVETFNALNEGVKTWQGFAELWAEYRPLSVREQLQAAEVASEITASFRVLASKKARAITPKDRIVWDRKIFDIAGIQPIGREGLEILAAARNDGGV